MKPDGREHEVVDLVRDHLERSTEALDASTSARLREARLKALAAAEGRGWIFRVPRWLTAGGVATVTAAAIAGVIWFADVRTAADVATLDDMEIVAAKEQMQLYEDLEFYRWLAARENGS